jgi:hypothetical protein
MFFPHKTAQMHHNNFKLTQKLIYNAKHGNHGQLRLLSEKVYVENIRI